MKKLILFSAIFCFIAISCANNKKLSGNNSAEESLNGTWELDYISGPRIAFNGLYPDKKPTLTFDTKNKKITGNTSCNSINGALILDGNKINFREPMAMTRMFCPGEGENVFVETLKKVNTYSISEGNTLTFIMGDIAIMRFKKK